VAARRAFSMALLAIATAAEAEPPDPAVDEEPFIVPPADVDLAYTCLGGAVVGDGDLAWRVSVCALVLFRFRPGLRFVAFSLYNILKI